MSVAPVTSRQDPSNGGTEKNSDARKRKARKWRTVRKKHERIGVIEINEEHERYDLLNLIRHGLRVMLRSTNDQEPPKEQVRLSDFTKVDSSSLTADGVTFDFTSYAGHVFYTLRRALGLAEEEYAEAISPETLPYLEFISNSKSGQHFYISNNQSYFMKTEKKKFVEYFLGILQKYLQYFLKYPHSLIVKYLGIYSIKVPGHKIKYFLIMQSIFSPHERIEKRFDLKGCLVNRYQKPPPEGAQVVMVYKDQNFENTSIEIGGQRKWLIEQLTHDVTFLRSLGAIDYSLLLGYHDLHEDERNNDLGDIVNRVKKSLATSVNEGSLQKSTTTIANVMATRTFASIDDCIDEIDETPNSDFPSRGSVILDGPLSFLDEETQQNDYISRCQNRRLLVMSKNQLHVIDGPNRRYYIGIVDFFMKYGLKQRIERVLKAMLRCNCNHSTQRPDFYADRFLRFMTEHIE